LELTVGKYVGFYIRIFYVLVPGSTPATPKHDETRTKLLPTRPPCTLASRHAKPTMGVKNFHKVFIERNGYDAGDQASPKYSLYYVERVV